MEIIHIDGNAYDVHSFTEEARAQLVSLQVTDQKIAELQAQMAIYQTARMSYARALKELLPQQILTPTHVAGDTASAVH